MSAAQLIKMANQIAQNQANLGDPDATAERVADHLKRFWAPSMRERLATEIEDANSTGVNAVVKTALQLIADQK